MDKILQKKPCQFHANDETGTLLFIRCIIVFFPRKLSAKDNGWTLIHYYLARNMKAIAESFWEIKNIQDTVHMKGPSGQIRSSPRIRPRKGYIKPWTNELQRHQTLYVSFSFSWPVNRLCGILFNRFILVCIFDPACELLPGCPHGRRNYMVLVYCCPSTVLSL